MELENLPLITVKSCVRGERAQTRMASHLLCDVFAEAPQHGDAVSAEVLAGRSLTTTAEETLPALHGRVANHTVALGEPSDIAPQFFNDADYFVARNKLTQRMSHRMVEAERETHRVYHGTEVAVMEVLISTTNA